MESALPRTTRARARGLSGTAVALLLTVVAVNGCGSGAGPSSVATMPACDSPGVSANEVRIGLVYPDVGLVARSLVPARSGINARIELADAQGGIHGRKIVYEWRDDAAEPRANELAVQDLVERESVLALLEATTAASGCADYLRSHGVPAVGLPAAEEIWFDPEYPNLFSFPSSVAGGTPADTFGRYARAQGGTKAVLVTEPVTPSSRSFGAEMERSLAAADLPMQTIEFNPNIGDARRLGENLRETGFDILILGVTLDVVPEVVAAARSAGIQ